MSNINHVNMSGKDDIIVSYKILKSIKVGIFEAINSHN